MPSGSFAAGTHSRTATGQDTTELDELAAELDDEIIDSGVRGNVLPNRPARRHRSTRRRQDAPDLPRRKIEPHTIGKTYTAPDDTVRFDDDQLPVWHEPTGRYLDPATGEFLPTWDQALDATAPVTRRCTSPGSAPSSTPRAS